MKRVGKRKAAKTAKRAAALKHDAIDDLVAAGAQALGLTLDPAWHAAVKFNLRLILSHAARLDEFPLPDAIEPGPIFHA
ncbi:MAG TPA: DUF4089 domain-containing protein [Xanthobacteraceae bacterium]|nr:DUF4089 domain-containing protein [Xanthobacteraceae bacterium]